MNEIEEVRQMIRTAAIDGHLEHVALKIYCAYASNPAMMPPQDSTLEALRRLAIDQAKAFLADLHPSTPAPIKVATAIDGFQLRIRINICGVDTEERYKLANGDLATRIYIAERLEEISDGRTEWIVEVNDLNETGPWVLSHEAILDQDPVIATEWIKTKHQEQSGR